MTGKVPDTIRNQLGIAIAQRIYPAYESLQSSERSRRVYNSGARPQRLSLGQHRDQGRNSFGHSVSQGAGSTV